ncbi:Hypothetical protein SRAE_2000063900 [Strongyloides ratti]|uniref:Integral membrane protein n=1 Tax=Strongyloides ratti TaxID=34506 RepID=A0A090LEK8_STRRB|nr:Hypothetical protein SRAE_2000063900 [Strongyloides ratti]CEF65965.1 Hypothetical protein SRAE_2000063900 [Strongyloides ratti]
MDNSKISYFQPPNIQRDNSKEASLQVPINKGKNSRMSDSFDDDNFANDKKRPLGENIKSNILGLFLVIILFIISLIIYIFGLLYFSKLRSHSLGCGFFVIENYNQAFKNETNANNRTEILIMNGIMANIFADGNYHSEQKKHAQKVYNEYKSNMEFYKDNCIKIKEHCSTINTIRKKLEENHHEYTPNDKTLYSWMVPKAAFSHKGAIFLIHGSFILTLLLIIGFILKFLFISKNHQGHRIIFIIFTVLTTLLTLLRLIFTLAVYISFDGLKDYLIMTTFIMTALNILHLLLIILIQVKKKM